MMGRKAVVGLSLLSALLFCAFAAQSASAAVSTSKNTTAFTCVTTGGTTNKDFKDEHCDEKVTPGTGSFEHKLIVGSTEISGTNEKVTEETKKSEIATLKGKILGGLIKSNIQCEVVKNNRKESHIENTEPELKAHTFSGTVVVEFTKCKVVEPTNCVVKEPIIARAIVHGVEGLEGPKAEKNAMGVEFIGDGEKETYTEIVFPGEPENSSKCVARNNTFKVQGKVYATSGNGKATSTENAQENKNAGATVVNTPKFKMQELKFAGEAAEFENISTAFMESATGVRENPITLTTTT
jgi:hypothetical protein